MFKILRNIFRNFDLLILFKIYFFAHSLILMRWRPFSLNLPTSPNLPISLDWDIHDKHLDIKLLYTPVLQLMWTSFVQTNRYSSHKMHYKIIRFLKLYRHTQLSHDHCLPNLPLMHYFKASRRNRGFISSYKMISSVRILNMLNSSSKTFKICIILYYIHMCLLAFALY